MGIQPFLNPPGQRIRAPFRVLMAGALLSGLLWIGSPATVRAEGGDQGDSSCTNNNPTSAGLSGTGEISNGPLDLSAGGSVVLKVSGGLPTDTNGDWRVQFNNVGTTSLNGAVFKATSLLGLNFCTINDEPSQPPGLKFRALGTLTGPSVTACTVAPGYSIQVLAVDRGEPGRSDSLQVRLFCGPSDSTAIPVYNSLDDFPVVPVAANKLSSGNYQIQNRP